MEAPRVVLVTDLAVVAEAELVRRIEAARDLELEARAHLAVQLRDVGLPARERLAFGRRIAAVVRSIGARLFVNDRLDLALALGADGVHLRADSVACADARRLVGDAFVTRACHGERDVLAAADEGCDGALLSPIFASPNKGAPLGVAALTSARAALDRRGFAHVALLALGGVDASNAQACREAGAHGVAVVRANLSNCLHKSLTNK